MIQPHCLHKSNKRLLLTWKSRLNKTEISDIYYKQYKNKTANNFGSSDIHCTLVLSSKQI